MGSTTNYTLNFSQFETWIDLTVLNQITSVEQKYELAVIESQNGKRKAIDFII